MGGREVGGLANQLAAHMSFDVPTMWIACVASGTRPEYGDTARASRPSICSTPCRRTHQGGLDRGDQSGRQHAARRFGKARRSQPARSSSSPIAGRPTRQRSPMSCCRPRAGARRTAPSPIPNGASRASAPSAPRPARRGRIGGCSPKWRAAWAGKSNSPMPARQIFSANMPRCRVSRTRAAASSTLALFADLSAADYRRDRARSMAASRKPERATADASSRTAAFPRPDRNAHFIATPFKPAAAKASRRKPFILNTGRMRDQWHTMTRTGCVPRLMTHQEEPFLELHPRDATKLCLEDGDMVRVETEHASTVLRAKPNPALRVGEIFAPMHWTDDFVGSGPVGKLVNGVCDPISGQPELKATAARLAPVADVVERHPVQWSRAA